MAIRLVVYAPAESVANRAATAAFARISALNQILSDYEPESELMRLSRTAGSGRAVPVGPDLLQVLVRSQRLSELSEGAFDITVGPAVQLWRKSRRERKLPEAFALEKVRQAISYREVKLDERAKTVELKCPGMRLDAGGIAAGYAVDEALAVLKREGIRSALLDASGDIGVSGPPPGTQGWRIGIAPLDPEAPPSRYVLLKNCAVTTSGDAYQFVEIEGVRYSHIVNPKTGLGLTTRSAATVIAADCTTADSYATAVCVLGPEHGLKLIEATPQAAAILVTLAHGKPQVHTSRRLSQYLVPNQP